jgi:hypothetical protein
MEKIIQTKLRDLPCHISGSECAGEVIHLDTNSVLQPVRDPERMLDVSWLCIINPHHVIQKQWLHHKPAKILASTALKKPGNSLSPRHIIKPRNSSAYTCLMQHTRNSHWWCHSLHTSFAYSIHPQLYAVSAPNQCVQSIQDPEDTIHSTMFQLQVIDPYVSAHISIATKSITLTLFKC